MAGPSKKALAQIERSAEPSNYSYTRLVSGTNLPSRKPALLRWARAFSENAGRSNGRKTRRAPRRGPRLKTERSRLRPTIPRREF